MTARVWTSLIACMMASASATAQGTVSSFNDLRGILKVGDTITVSESSGTSTKGTILELTGSSLLLRVGTAERRYEEPEVGYIRWRHFDSLVNGAVIGAAVGAAISAVVLTHCSGDFGCSDMAGAFLGLSTGVGLGIGLGLDALIVDERVVYERPSTRRAGLRLAPIVGRGHLGAVLFVRF